MQPENFGLTVIQNPAPNTTDEVYIKLSLKIIKEYSISKATVVAYAKSL